MDIRLDTRQTTAPEFNNAQAVFGEIQGKMDTLRGQWDHLSALMEALKILMTQKPEPPDTSGMKSEDAAAAMQKYRDGPLNTWQGQVADLQGNIEKQQKDIEKTTNELSRLQNVKLPQAQNKDRQDYEKWADDQKKQMEGLTSNLNTEVGRARIGGDKNADIVRTEIRQLEVKHVAFRQSIIQVQIASQAQPPEQVRRNLGLGPPRDSGLTIE